MTDKMPDRVYVGRGRNSKLVVFEADESDETPYRREDLCADNTKEEKLKSIIMNLIDVFSEDDSGEDFDPDYIVPEGVKFKPVNPSCSESDEKLPKGSASLRIVGGDLCAPAVDAKRGEALEALEDLTAYAANVNGGIGFRDVMDLTETIRQTLTAPDHTELLREVATDLEYISVRLQNGIVVLDKQLERDARAALTYTTQTITKINAALGRG